MKDRLPLISFHMLFRLVLQSILTGEGPVPPCAAPFRSASALELYRDSDEDSTERWELASVAHHFSEPVALRVCLQITRKAFQILHVVGPRCWKPSTRIIGLGAYISASTRPEGIASGLGGWVTLAATLSGNSKLALILGATFSEIATHSTTR